MINSSSRHANWLEFTHYQEYSYLIRAQVSSHVASFFSSLVLIMHVALLIRLLDWHILTCSLLLGSAISKLHI